MDHIWFWLLGGLVLVGIFSRRATSAKSFIGSAVNLEHQAQQSDTLKVATFNIQTGKSLAGKRDILRSAAVLAETHLAGIQEVYAQGWLNSFGIGASQTASLVKGSQLKGVFAATRRRWFREHRGNAILTGLNIKSWQSTMLPDQSGKSYRNMMVAKLDWQGQDFYFINTHLHTGAGRGEQLEVVRSEFAKHARVILTGDFNCAADSPELEPFLASDQVDDAVKLAGVDRKNPHRIDWILTKGFQVVDGQMLEPGVSDHPFYQVSLKYL